MYVVLFYSVVVCIYNNALLKLIGLNLDRRCLYILYTNVMNHIFNESYSPIYCSCFGHSFSVQFSLYYNILHR